MIYELRTYEIDPELIDEYLVRADKVLLPIIKEKVGFRLIGFWRAISETGGTLPRGETRQIPSQVVWMIQWENVEERNKKWAELSAHPDWQREFDRKYYKNTHMKFISPTEYSPLQ